MEGKMYRLFGKNGTMEEVKPHGSLPIGTKVVAIGFAGVEQIFCLTSEQNEHGIQEMCLISRYSEESYFGPKCSFDKYSNPLSKKFGIGFYWDDIKNTVYPASKVKAAIRRANYLERKREKKAIAKEEADRIQIEAYPKEYPHLKPVTGRHEYVEIKSNLVAELKKHFPNQKFSIKKENYDSIAISWTNGVTVDEVCKVSRKFVSYVTDVTGDFRDYEPSNFNRVFGGFKYVSEYREMSEDIKELHCEFEEYNKLDKYESHKILRQLFCRTSIPTGAKNFKIKRNEVMCGSSNEFYDLVYEVEEVAQKSEVNKSVVGEVQIVDYSEKSFAIIGNTKPIKDTLKELGGRFNFKLNCGAGWIFPLTKKEAVLSALAI